MKHHKKLFSSDLRIEKFLIEKLRKAKDYESLRDITKLSISSYRNNDNTCYTDRIVNQGRVKSKEKEALKDYSSGINLFINKTLPKMRKEKPLPKKEINCFTFLPSTRHKQGNFNYKQTVNLSPYHSNIKLKPLALITKSIQLQITETILKRKLEEYEEIKQKKPVSTDPYLPKITSEYKPMNINEEKKKKYLSSLRNDTLYQINCKISYPMINKDNQLFGDIYNNNINSLKKAMKIKYDLIE